MIKNIIILTTIASMIASCSSTPKPKPLKLAVSDMEFSKVDASKKLDPDVVLSVITEIELPGIYAINGKYTVCEMSFNLAKLEIGYSPSNAKANYCITNDESGFLIRECLASYSDWRFSPRKKGGLVSKTKRYTGTCALRGKSLNKLASNDGCWVHIEKAMDLRISGRYQDSLDEIEKHGACDKSPVKMSYFYHKGWTYHEMGDYRKAINAFTKGLESQPTYFYAYWRRGLSYEALGDIDKAKEDYRQGYEVGVKKHGTEFFTYMEKNPDVKEKLVQDWGA